MADILCQKAILFRVDGSWNMPRQDTAALYECTRGIWHIGEKRENAAYAVAVFSSVIHGVFTIDKWHPGLTTKYTIRDASLLKRTYENLHRRFEFTGESARDLDMYLGKQVEMRGRNAFEYATNLTINGNNVTYESW